MSDQRRTGSSGSSGSSQRRPIRSAGAVRAALHMPQPGSGSGNPDLFADHTTSDAGSYADDTTSDTDLSVDYSTSDADSFADHTNGSPGLYASRSSLEWYGQSAFGQDSLGPEAASASASGGPSFDQQQPLLQQTQRLLPPGRFPGQRQPLPPQQPPQQPLLQQQPLLPPGQLPGQPQPFPPQPLPPQPNRRDPRLVDVSGANGSARNQSGQLGNARAFLRKLWEPVRYMWACFWNVLVPFIRRTWPWVKLIVLPPILLYALWSLYWHVVGLGSVTRYCGGTWASAVRFRDNMLAEQEGGALWYQAIFQTAAPLLGYASLAADKAPKRATFTATIRPVKPILPKLLDAFAAHDALEDSLDSWLGWEFKTRFLPSASVTMSEINLRYWLGNFNQQLHTILEEAETSFQMLQSELQQEPASRHFLAANNTASGPGVFCRAVGPSLAAHLFCSPSDDFRATREVWLRFRELGRVLRELHDGVKPLLARAAGDDVEMWMIRPSGDGKNPQMSVRLMVQRFTEQMCKAAKSCQDLLRKDKLDLKCSDFPDLNKKQHRLCTNYARKQGPPDMVRLADHMQGAEAAFRFFCYTAKVSSEQYDALFSRRDEGLHGLLKALKANMRRVEQHMARLSSSLSQYRGRFGHAQPANVEESIMREIILQCQQELQPFFYKEGEKVEEEPDYEWNEPVNV